ncbi:hypothetical protein [Draconibacterium mangrovi]|uniref:hypothetical protein n=1 Tax=Draconibacterium mangrovi TaxID=2697469 RepID=UPI0013D59934|nr:hypothetical protein [Draconibacterium mangrovi]
MKTLFVGIIAMCVASVAMASGNLRVNMEANENEATVVEISSGEMVHFEIELTDEYGNSIYEMNSEVPRSEMEKRYDFSALDNGTYWYYVRTGDEEIRKQLSIEYGEVEVMDVRKTVEPYFFQEGDQIILSYLNFENENINLYVYENNTLLTEVALGKDFAIHKAIDLSKLNYGEYEVVLTNENDIYEHSVVIE